jgi:hypothetical protein
VRGPSAWESVSWSNELIVRQSTDSKDVNTESDDAATLEAVTRRQTVKIQQSEKASYMLQSTAE